MKISRREAKECMHWLELILEANDNVKNTLQPIQRECEELKNILSAIIIKSE
jgi:four helix bundle protein